jgi:integrase
MAVRAAMRRACIAAGIPHYHPHDLRHRRASLWHGQGVVGAEVAKRGGWSKPTVPLNVYSHVMPLDEVEAGAFEGVLR